MTTRGRVVVGLSGGVDCQQEFSGPAKAGWPVHGPFGRNATGNVGLGQFVMNIEPGADRIGKVRSKFNWVKWITR